MKLPRYRLEYPVEPVVKGRPRVARYGNFFRIHPDPKSDRFENRIADMTYKQIRERDLSEMDGRLKLEATFYTSRREGDLDNFGKAVLDGIQMTGKKYPRRLFPDDKVFDVIELKRFFVAKGAEGIIVEIESLDTDNGIKRLSHPSPFGFSIPIEEDLF